MIVKEAYRNVEVRVCYAHYCGDKPLPSDAPALGQVQDARDSEGCDFCCTSADHHREAAAIMSDTAQRSGPWARRSRD